MVLPLDLVHEDFKVVRLMRSVEPAEAFCWPITFITFKRFLAAVKGQALTYLVKVPPFSRPFQASGHLEFTVTPQVH